MTPSWLQVALPQGGFDPAVRLGASEATLGSESEAKGLAVISLGADSCAGEAVLGGGSFWDKHHTAQK